MTKQQLHELSSKLVKKFGDEILSESFDFYTNLTSLIESGEVVDMDIKYADVLESLCKKRAILEYRTEAYSIVSETLEDSDYVLKLMQESMASEKARRLGLRHKGFGWYYDPKNEKNIYRSTGEKLVKASSATIKSTTDDSKNKKIRKKSAESGEGTESKPSKEGSKKTKQVSLSKTSKGKKDKDSVDVKTQFSKKHSTKYKKKTDEEGDKLPDFHKGSIHITNVMRVDPVKYIYKFKLNGEEQIIELRKEEYSSEKPISHIIFNKVKERQFEKGKFTPYEKTTGRRGLRKSYTSKSKKSKRHFEDEDDVPAFLKKGKDSEKKKSKKKSD